MKFLEFALTLGKLKNIKRTGWKRHNIPNPESVAEHSFRVAVLSMVLAPKVGADINKSVKMALIHDIGEAEIGDIMTWNLAENDAKLKEKVSLELLAMQNIFSSVGGNEYIVLFEEYNANLTKEAQLVKQIDKLEMAIQAYEYEKQHKIDLQEFFNYTVKKVKDPVLNEILKEINKLRGN